jgi:peptidoglycan/LPS O-acetylase OafA/YrhL
MDRRAPRRWAAVLLAAWSILVWAGRLRNMVADDELALGRGALAASFVVGGLLVLWAAIRRARWLPVAVRAVAWWTIGVWILRGIGILLADHPAEFEIVHTALAVISIGIAVLALRSATTSGPDRRRVPASGTGSRPRP